MVIVYEFNSVMEEFDELELVESFNNLVFIYYAKGKTDDLVMKLPFY